jgi:hypothetical protein
MVDWRGVYYWGRVRRENHAVFYNQMESHFRPSFQEVRKPILAELKAEPENPGQNKTPK